MRRDDERLDDIIESATLIARYVERTTFAELLGHDMLQDAIIRRLTIIGEAANGVSMEIRATYPTVPWSQMASFRHFVVHEYFRMDWKIVWETATTHVPKLVLQIEQVLSNIRRQ